MEQPLGIKFRSIKIKEKQFYMLDGITPVTEPYYMKWVSRAEHLSFREFEDLLKQHDYYRKLIRNINELLEQGK